MQQSSERIGTIAEALAKAQAELTNPEKSYSIERPILDEQAESDLGDEDAQAERCSLRRGFLL
jgi:hypothetical protein